MVLTGKERQARYLQRLKDRASLDAFGAQARQAVDQAIGAIWSYLSRPDEEGRLDGFLDGVANVTDLRASFAREGNLTEVCRDLLRFAEKMTEREAKAMAVLVEIADAVDLTAERPVGGQQSKGAGCRPILTSK